MEGGRWQLFEWKKKIADVVSIPKIYNVARRNNKRNVDLN